MTRLQKLEALAAAAREWACAYENNTVTWSHVKDVNDALAALDTPDAEAETVTLAVWESVTGSADMCFADTQRDMQDAPGVLWRRHASAGKGARGMSANNDAIRDAIGRGLDAPRPFGLFSDAITNILSALTAAGYAVEQGWQPIETAKKTDEQIILLLSTNSIVPLAGWWHRGHWRYGEKGRPVFPTHWRPLPAPLGSWLAGCLGSLPAASHAGRRCRPIRQ